MKLVLQDNRVLDLAFPDVPSSYDTKYYKEDLRHQDLADKLKEGYELQSIIIFCDRLRMELWDDPAYALKTTKILCSEVEEQARDMMTNKYHHMDKAKEILIENGVEFDPGNSGDINKNHKSDLIDAFYEAQTQFCYSEIVSNLKCAYKYPYDEETDEEGPERTDEEVEELWKKEGLKYFLPRTRVLYERLYSMPSILGHWDSRCPWQQYFFITKDGKTEYVIGGTGGSGTRYNLGLMTWTFLHLHSAGVKIPTHILHYTEDNQLVLLETHSTFKCLHPHNGCNYKPEERLAPETEERVCVNKHDYLEEKEDEI